MKSEKAELLLQQALTRNEYLCTGMVTYKQALNAVKMAEQEAEERMRRKAIEAFCAANCPKGCSFGADGNVGCEAKYRLIQKLNEE